MPLNNYVPAFFWRDWNLCPVLISHIHIDGMDGVASINSLRPSGANMQQQTKPPLAPIRCHAIIWTNADILSIGPVNFSEILMEIKIFHSNKWVWKCRLRNGGHFVSSSICLCSSHNYVYLSDQGDTTSTGPCDTIKYESYHICVYTMCTPYKVKRHRYLMYMCMQC